MPDLGDIEERPLDPQVDGDGLREGDSRQASRLDHEVALIELRHELGAEASEHRGAARKQEETETDRDRWPCEHTTEER